MLPPGEKRGPAQAPAYKELVKAVDLKVKKRGEWSEIKVPVLNPWGILIVEKSHK